MLRWGCPINKQRTDRLTELLEIRAALVVPVLIPVMELGAWMDVPNHAGTIHQKADTGRPALSG